MTPLKNLWSFYDGIDTFFLRLPSLIRQTMAFKV